MINKMIIYNNKYYDCKKCGLSYKEKKWAEKCEDWCKKHKSCNLNIVKHAVGLIRLRKFKRTNKIAK